MTTPIITADLYDGAQKLVVERSQHGDYCNFRVIRDDASTLIFIGGYAQVLRLDLFNSECARLSVGDTHVGLMNFDDGQAVARFLDIEPNVVNNE